MHLGKMQGSKNIFLPGSKPSTFSTFYTLSSPFRINRPILPHYLSLHLSFPFLSLLLSFLCFLFHSFRSFFLLPSWEIRAFQLPSWWRRYHATSFFGALVGCPLTPHFQESSINMIKILHIMVKILERYEGP